jgi:hypothetical protein
MRIRHSNAQRKIKGQKGSALVFALALVAGMALLVIAGMNASITQEYVLNRNQLQQQYLDEVATSAEQWYERVAPTIELTGEAVSEATLLGQIAPTRKFGIRAQIGPRFTKTVSPWTQPALGYRSILIWIPQSGSDTTSVSTTADVPTIDPLVATTKTYRSWSTLGYQQTQLAKLSDLLVKVGSLLQNWGRAQQGTRAGQSFDNFFRQADCAAAAIADHLPCLDTYVDLTTTTVPSYLGMSSTEFASPWGYSVEISNLLDSSTATMPYALSLRVHSPISTSDYLYAHIELPQ